MDKEHLILFLGSGASQFAGYSTFISFPHLIFDDQLRSREELPPLHSTTRDLLHEISAALQVDKQHTTHDNFLWRLDAYKSMCQTLSRDTVTAKRFLSDHTKRGDFAYFGQTTEDAINDITAITIKHYSRNRVVESRNSVEAHRVMRRVYELYTTLARLNQNKRPMLRIFTTNYDLLIEDLHAKFSGEVAPDMALINGIDHNIDEKAIWKREHYDLGIKQASGLFLHRLHGCVCWFYHGQQDPRVHFHRSDCLQMPETGICAMYPGRQVYRGIDPHAAGFRQLFQSLQQAKLAVFIGFAFRDDDVRHILLMANSARKVPLRIIVVDPVLRTNDILDQLEEGCKTSEFPARLLQAKQITVVPTRFGAENSDIQLLSIIQSIL